MIEIKTKLLSVLNPDTGRYEPIDTLRGDTPIKGVDYYTPAEKEELIDSVVEQTKIVKVAEQPTFVNDISECTDTSKLYVLPDGFIYAYSEREETTEGGTTPNFTNIVTKADTEIKVGYRYSKSGGAFKALSGCDSVIFSIPSSGTITLRFRDCSYYSDKTGGTAYPQVYGGTSKTAFTVEHIKAASDWLTDDNGDTYVTFTNSAGSTYAYVGMKTVDTSSAVITVNEEITYTTTEGGTTVIKEWINTGHAFVPANYEDRIIALEDDTAALHESVSDLEADVEALKERPVASTIATMVYAPSPQLPADGSETADFDAANIDANDIYAYIDALVEKHPRYLTKETLGKDGSGMFDWNRYTASRRTYDAWVKPTHPAMYAWTNGSVDAGTKTANFTNVLDSAEIKTGFRYSLSSAAFKELSDCDSVIIQIPSSGNITLRLRGCKFYYSSSSGAAYPQVYGGTSNTAFTIQHIGAESDWQTDNNGDRYVTFDNTAGSTYVTIGMNTVDKSTAIVTINEEITYTSTGGTTESTTIYSTSVSPRIGDTMYSTEYIGTVYNTVTAVDNANQNRTVNGLVFIRDITKDVAPTLVYTYSDYSPYRLGTDGNVTWRHNAVYNASQVSIGTIASVVNGTMTDANDNVYTRYPMGDRNARFESLPTLVIGSNEHGGNVAGDPAEPAIITARLIKDLCENKNANNPFLNMLKSEYMIVFCPIINPWGYGKESGYVNFNGVNLDRNFDTPGWGNDADTRHGDYGGSENETQHFMNTLYESGAKIALANHALGSHINTATGEAANAGACSYMFGRNDNKYNNYLIQIAETMSTGWGLQFYDMGEAPGDTYGKTRSYMNYIGIEGGAVEMCALDGYVLHGGTRHTADILEADYTLLLQFLQMLIECQG